MTISQMILEGQTTIEVQREGFQTFMVPIDCQRDLLFLLAAAKAAWGDEAVTLPVEIIPIKTSIEQFLAIRVGSEIRSSYP